MKVYTMKTPAIQAGDGFSSKGNLLKWLHNGYWYKADGNGYEGVAEVICAKLLHTAAQSTPDIPAEIIDYTQTEIHYGDYRFSGCRSKDFLVDRAHLQIVTLERLHQSFTGFGLAKHLSLISDTGARIRYTVDFVRNVTGLDAFDRYLTLMLEFDAFFLNEDRHFHNIAVLWAPDDDVYALCPYFDMGASLFSDTRLDFPLDQTFVDCRKKIRAKPFDTDFDIQLDAAQALYGYFLHFPFSSERMYREASALLQKHTDIADERIRTRILETLSYQAKKYQYMFD